MEIADFSSSADDGESTVVAPSSVLPSCSKSLLSSRSLQITYRHLAEAPMLYYASVFGRNSCAPAVLPHHLSLYPPSLPGALLRCSRRMIQGAAGVTSPAAAASGLSPSAVSSFSRTVRHHPYFCSNYASTVYASSNDRDGQ